MINAKWSSSAAFLLLTINYPVYSAEQAPVIVTATRTAQTMDESLASVSVITRQQLQASQAKSLMEVIAGLAGIDMTRNGGHGKSTNLHLRGTESDHVLLLIDGIKLGSATTGAAPWQFIPLSQIERIEIVRGPRSSLYGSEAIGGVIQIFTRKTSDALRISADAGGGSHNSRELNAAVSTGNDVIRYSLSAGRFDTDGIDARQTTDADRDGYDNTAVSGRVDIKTSDRLDIGLNFLHTEGNTEFDASTNNETDYTKQSFGLTFDYTPRDWWNSKLLLGRSLDESFNFRADGVPAPTRFDTRRVTASWQNDFYLGTNGVLTAGIDYQKDKVNSTTAYTVSSRDNKGVFFQYQDQLGKTDFLAGVRTDDNEQFGNHTTGNVSIGYPISNRLRLIASYGTAFKAPTFNELYFPGFGDPNNRPEESKTWEVGLRGLYKNTRWEITAYHNDIDNLIAFDADTGLAGNIDRARIKGLEASLTTRLLDWQARINLTLMDPRDTQTDNILARRSRRSLRIDLDREFGQWNFGTSLIAQGARFDNKSNTKRVGGYGVVNLYGGYKLHKHWTLRARIDNLLDKQYETADSFNSLDRTAMVMLAYTAENRYRR